MSTLLARKTLRDLRTRLPQSVAISVTVLVGVMLFVAGYDSFRNLEASYDRTYERTHFADFSASGDDPARLADAVRDMPGVARVSVRTEADVPMAIAGTKLLGRVVGYTADPDAVDRFDLLTGGFPSSADEVLVERHAADTFGLSPGSQISVFDGARWRVAAVSGVVASPEYLWPARSRQDVLGDPHSFAVAFAPQKNLADLPPNRTLVQMSGAATQSERSAVADRLGAAGATDVTTRAEQASNATLEEDLAGFSELAVGFPLLFLSAAAIAAYILLSRVVRGERRIIGTLLALGARPGALVRHYLGYGAVVATVGAVAGVLAGFAATTAVTRAYTGALDVPDTVVDHRIVTAAIGLAIGIVTGVLAAAAPALGAARVAPAAAMRGDDGLVGRAPRMHSRRLPVTARLAVRSLLRSRRRTAAVMIGTVLALVTVLSSVGMLTSMQRALDVQFGTADRADATVLTEPGVDDGARLAALPGVADVEPTTQVGVTVADAGRTYRTELTGLQPNTTMHGFGGSALPPSGLLAGAALGDLLRVGVGDTVTVIADGGVPTQFRIAGFVDEPLGTQLYGTVEQVRTLPGDRLDGSLLRFTAAADRDDIRSAATALPGVVAYTDTASLRTGFADFLSLYWVFVATMLVLGGVLACTVVYVTMTVTLAERSTELATLSAVGVPIRRLTTLLALENLLATAVAIPIGLAAGYGAAWLFLRSFDSDLFSLELSLGWFAPLLAVVATVFAAACAHIPAARLVAGIDIARVARERAP